MKESESNEIGNVFRMALDKLSVSPPEDIWDAIHVLALKTQIKRYRGLLFIVSLYALITTLIAAGGGLYYWKKLAHDTNNMIEASVAQKKPATIVKTVYKTIYKHIYINSSNGYSQSKTSLYDINLPHINTIYHTVANKKGAASYDSSIAIRLHKQQRIVGDTISKDSSEKDIQLSLLKKYNLKRIITKIKLPKILAVALAQTTEKRPKIQKPFTQRLSLASYYAVEGTNVNVIRTTPDAFNYGNETVNESSLWGVNVGYDISNKLSFITGLEFRTVQFASAVRKFPVTATIENGVPTYLYKTVMGVASVPTEQMTTTPSLDNTLMIESEDEHSVSMMRIPIGLKFYFADVKLNHTARNAKYLHLYGQLATTYNFTPSQVLNFEVYEADGHDFNASVNRLRNTQSFWDYSLSVGAESYLFKNTAIWVEPSYANAMSSVVKDLPLQTYFRTFSLKFGLRLHF